MTATSDFIKLIKSNQSSWEQVEAETLKRVLCFNVKTVPDDELDLPKIVGDVSYWAVWDSKAPEKSQIKHFWSGIRRGLNGRKDHFKLHPSVNKIALGVSKGEYTLISSVINGGLRSEPFKLTSQYDHFVSKYAENWDLEEPYKDATAEILRYVNSSHTPNDIERLCGAVALSSVTIDIEESSGAVALSTVNQLTDCDGWDRLCAASGGEPSGSLVADAFYSVTRIAEEGAGKIRKVELDFRESRDTVKIFGKTSAEMRVYEISYFYGCDKWAEIEEWEWPLLKESSLFQVLCDAMAGSGKVNIYNQLKSRSMTFWVSDSSGSDPRVEVMASNLKYQERSQGWVNEGLNITRIIDYITCNHNDLRSRGVNRIVISAEDTHGSHRKMWVFGDNTSLLATFNADCDAIGHLEKIGTVGKEVKSVKSANLIDLMKNAESEKEIVDCVETSWSIGLKEGLSDSNPIYLINDLQYARGNCGAFWRAFVASDACRLARLFQFARDYQAELLNMGIVRIGLLSGKHSTDRGIYFYGEAKRTSVAAYTFQKFTELGVDGMIAELRRIRGSQQKEETLMGTDNKETVTTERRVAKVLQTISEDGRQMALRTGARQTIKLVRDPLVAALAMKMAPGDAALRTKLAVFFSTEVGEAMIGFMLSLATQVAGGKVARDPSHVKLLEGLSRELYLESGAKAMDFVVDIAMGPLREGLTTMVGMLDSGSLENALPAMPNLADLGAGNAESFATVEEVVAEKVNV